ncbi:hypothetical protein M404DRAFT_388684 [Pisolithus tinctorius Marx 270]|uniref:Uncharacterized protein n=1 Tax=Pisolithus tinctorius Marx 270 TaxID=870435 RepID=A0A0C3PHR3_PISTI|nr:hypothetical protein M404DRAFT_388684 [Pisolithus tinctorius Marx 270]
MATYSAFFSSGLLAPGITRPSSPIDPVDRESLQPPITPTTPHAKPVAANAGGERPRMRRRRSSINIAASPMAAIKSPSRNATSAFQRAGIMSPTRSRAGSVNEASENNSLFGRMRSGSVTVMQSVRSYCPSTERPPPGSPSALSNIQMFRWTSSSTDNPPSDPTPTTLNSRRWVMDR